MKSIIIGDIHHRASWKQIVNSNMDADKIVFIGDYFDSFDIPHDKGLENFKDIIAFKKAYPDKVILLLGNHDLHYMKWLGIDARYSGFNYKYSFAIEDQLRQAYEDGLFELGYLHNKYLITHAGVSKTWIQSWFGLLPYDNPDIVGGLKTLFHTKPYAYKFLIGDNYSETGDDVTQGPLWIRPRSLEKDSLEEYHHIVGHTEVKEIATYKNITLIDCLQYGYYLEINDHILITRKL